MIICTRCGQDNDDEQRFCTRCNRKLQSSHIIPDADGDETAAVVTRLRLKMMGVNKVLLLRCLEAWAYALVLLITALWCGRNGIWWPLYVLLPALGLLMWLRRV